MKATIETIREAVSRTREARERVQPHRSTDAVIAALSQAAKNWLAPDSRWRKQAVQYAPQHSGFSEVMVNEAIDLTFGAIHYESLGELLDRELGNRRVLDEFCLRGRLQSRAVPPRMLVHFLAGNVPMPGIVSICCGYLLRTANIVKVASRDPVFPTLFIESVREVDAELADCVAALEWSRSELELTKAALDGVDAVIAYGDDRTIAALRQLAGMNTRFSGYGHKLSFGVIAKEAMTEENLPKLAEAAAFDASVYDQLGCLSPHVYYVEERGQLGPRKFAVALAEAMAAYHARVPRGQLSVEEAAQVTQFRSAYEFRAASDRRFVVHNGGTANDWSVIYDDSPAFMPSCLNRTIFVKPTDGYKRVLDAVQKISAHISTVGVAPMHERAAGFAVELAKMGVHRVCPIGQMQRPPLSWQHDGRPNLGELVSWTDLG